MLYHFLYPLKEIWFPFNVFRYITFRTAGAGVTSAFIFFLLAPRFIKFIEKKGFYANPRDPALKDTTPKLTLGGVLILFSVLISTILWADITKGIVLLALSTTLGMGLIGLFDDFMKIKLGDGVKARWKLLYQAIIAGIVSFFLLRIWKNFEFATSTNILFFKEVLLKFGILYPLFVVIVLLSTVNSANLADGLDGLAAGLSLEAAVAYAILAYIAGNIKASSYLGVIYVPGCGEITVFLSSVAGALLGFLWYNFYPARIIMGDVGAMGVGGAIGISAILTKQEILLIIVGGVFVLEALSVILQVMYFKITGGKRIFRMTPLHHHYQLKGDKEPQIVVRFWILGLIFMLFALSTLKLR